MKNKPLIRYDVDYLNDCIPIEDVIERYAGMDITSTRVNIKCPFPNASVTHKKGDHRPSARIYKNNGSNSCYCFTCGKFATPVQFAQLYFPSLYFSEVCAKLASDFGVPLERCSNIDEIQNAEIKPVFSESFPLTFSELEALGFSFEGEETPEKPLHENVMPYVMEMKKNIGQTDYHRGLSPQTLDHFNVGFDKNWVHPDFPFPKFKFNGYPRIIIPTGENSYLARLAVSLPDKDFEKEIKCGKVGNVKIFNKEVLQTSREPIFIAEGEIDAMSFYEIGCSAIGLGGTGSVSALLKELEENRPSQILIIAADNDEAGTNSKMRLMQGLDELHIDYIVKNLYFDCKDANEALNKHREDFRNIAYETKIYATRVNNQNKYIPAQIKNAKKEIENTAAFLYPKTGKELTVQDLRKTWYDGNTPDKEEIEDFLISVIDSLLKKWDKLHDECLQAYTQIRDSYTDEQMKGAIEFYKYYSKMVQDNPTEKMSITPEQVKAVQDVLIYKASTENGVLSKEKRENLNMMKAKITSLQHDRKEFYRTHKKRSDYTK